MEIQHIVGSIGVVNGYCLICFLLKLKLNVLMWMYALRCILGETKIGGREEGMLVCSSHILLFY